jgi:hypothetical protein
MNQINLCNLTLEQTYMSHLSNRQWYFERSLNRDSLVISVGDSWSWGMGLQSDNNSDNIEYRTNHCYGSIVAKSTNSDFINIGFPGYSNMLHINYAFDVLNRLVKPYKKIFVLLTLSESGRDISDDFYKRPEYYNLLRGGSWPTFNDIVTGSVKFNELRFALKELKSNNIYFEYPLKAFLRAKNFFNTFDIVKSLEKTSFKMLVDKIKQQGKNIHYVVGRTYVDTFKENVSILDSNFCLLSKKWVDILAEHTNNLYPTNVYNVTQIGIDTLFDFDNFVHSTADLRSRTELIESSLSAIHWLESCSLTRGEVPYPTEQGHQLWANYILENIKHV